MFTKRWLRVFIVYLLGMIEFALTISFVFVPLILGGLINVWWFALYIITLPALGASIYCDLKERELC
jgi:hypothetical protein